MGTSRQATLMESWGGGRGFGVPGPGPSMPPPGPSRGGRQKFNKPRGGGRGRGRGGRGKRGRGRGGTSGGQCAAGAEGAFDDDEDDGICDAALRDFELQTNDLSKAFEEVNASKDLPGFDTSAGDIWIYPTNRPVRDYQFNIVQTALYHNTLVSLPTGLGKTFIAAVVMYNFYRWYPNNIIVFMAPTRPLVTQQLDACNDLMGIPPSKMIELTGQTIPKKREDLWKEKKVFFLTPQVMTSDLGRGFCPAEQVRCVVVDEAHKSLGNHAYAQVIKMLAEKNKCFRVLGLSATPGNDIAAVQQVLQNLLISRVELRSETSQDILPYTHQKQIETVVVPLDDLIKSVYDKVMEIFQMYTGKLMKMNVLFGRDGSSFTPFQLLRARELFRENPPPHMANYQRGYTEADFATCITLSHSTELLLVHGLRSFYSFLHGVVNKQKSTPAVAAELKKNTNIEDILAEVQTKLNISADNSIFDLSTSGLFTTFSKPGVSDLPEPTNPEDYLLSHPKMRVLKSIVYKHFQSFQAKSESTRVMIFSQYRDSVQEIGNMLNSLRPLVKPMVFIGQAKSSGNTSGRGLKQKEQIQVVQGFRSGGFNVLVSTCVGEEGLDIGEVDLIICFDSSKSPTRLVQRMGRTGRQRQGRTIFLLAEGKEQRMYNMSVSQYGNISRTITDTSQLNPYLYKQSPRMVPVGINPQCYKMEIILSSEQRADEVRPVTQIGRVINLDDDDDSSLERVPRRTVAAKGSTAKKQKKSSDSSTNPGSTGSVNTITKCFKNANKKVAASPKPGSTGQNTNNMVCDPPEQLPRIDEDNSSDCYILDNEHDVGFQYNEPANAMYGENYGNYIRKMLGVPKVDGNTVAKCVFVPKVSDPITWRPEFNDLDPKRVMLQDFEVRCLREKLNAVYMMGPSSSRCECGLVHDDNLFDFGEDFEVDGDFPANTSSESHSCATAKEERIPFESTGSKFNVPSKAVAQEPGRSEESTTFATKSKESTFATEFDAGFLMDANDPFFTDDWTGEMEEDVSKVPPVSTSTPRIDIDSFKNKTESKAEERKIDIKEVKPTVADFDSDSTVSDDAFGPVLFRRNSNSNTLNQSKSDTPKSMPAAQNASRNVKSEVHASSSDEWFPPSPEVAKPVVKKKFVFKKKVQTTLAIPLQNLIPMAPQSVQPMPHIPAPTSLLSNRATVGSSDNFMVPKSPRRQSTISNTEPRQNHRRKTTKAKSKNPFVIEEAGASGDDEDSADESSALSPVSRSSSQIGSFNFQKKAANPEEHVPVHSNKTGEPPIQLAVLDIDSDSTTLSDDAFGPVLNRRNTGVENSMKPVPSNRVPVVENSIKPVPSNRIPVAEKPSHPAQSNFNASSSDEWFPPSPQETERVVKKKFVFQKKIKPASPVPAQEPILVSQVIKSSVLPLRSSALPLRPTPPRRPTPQTLRSTPLPLRSIPRPLSSPPMSFLSPAVPIRSPPVPVTSPPRYGMGIPTRLPFRSPPLSLLSPPLPMRSSPMSMRSSPVRIQSTMRPPPQASPLPVRAGLRTFTIEDTDDDAPDSGEIFIVPKPPRAAPSTSNASTRQGIFEASSFRRPAECEASWLKRRVNFEAPPSRFQPSTSSSTEPPHQAHKSKRRKRNNVNPFVVDEAEVSGDEEDSMNEDSGSDMDDMDMSFVSTEKSPRQSESQQIRYMRSVRDAYLNPRKPGKRALDELVIEGLNANKYTESQYEEDSFVVRNDDVEFEEIGAFTQAMQIAQNAVVQESPRTGAKKKLRSHRRAQQQKGRSPVVPKPKRRRRIIVPSPSDDDDD